MKKQYQLCHQSRLLVSSPSTAPLLGCAFLALSLLPIGLQAATISKADNNTALDATGSWSGGVVPTSADIACFGASGCTAFTANRTPAIQTGISVLGIKAGTSRTVTVGATGGGSFTIGASGIDMTGATADFTANCGHILTASQTWTIPSSRTYTTAANKTITTSGGAWLLTIAGSGTFVWNSQASSAFTGPITINMTGGGTVRIGNTAANTFASGLTNASGKLVINTVDGLGNAKLNIVGGSLDCENASLAALTKPSGGYNWYGDFTFVGTQPLNLGTMGVSLFGNRQVTVTANTLTVGGVIADGGSGFSLTKAGVGRLLLTAANTYSGTTAVNDGKLVGQTGGSSASSAVSVAPGKTLGVLYAGSNGKWTCASVTSADSTCTVELDFNSSTPSGTVAPLDSTGALTYTGGTPPILTVANATLSDGASYPLISYGSGGGTLPTPSFVNTGGKTGTLRLVSGTPNVIWLDVTTTTNLHWASGNGTWAVGRSDTLWKSDNTSAPADYGDGNFVSLLDTDISTSPTLTLDTTVIPGKVVANHSTFNYTISGVGGIGGGTALTKSGSGTLTLDVDNTYSGLTTISNGTLSIGSGGSRGSVASSITNAGSLVINRSGSLTYSGLISGGGAVTINGPGTVTLNGASFFSGGTTLSSGQLNINNGGDATHSAIGIGALTIGGVCTIDNTSGSGITLNPNMAVNLNADFTYAGSNPLNTGTGATTLGGNRQITVNGSFITMNGVIADGGNTYTLTKAGSGGILVLAKANTYSGGTTLNAGTLYINNASGLGAATGTFTINGGTIGNTSGATVTTGNYPQAWNGDFSMAGNNDLNLGTGGVMLGASRQVNIGGTLTLTVGGVIGDGGNSYGLTKAGTGTMALTGINTYAGKTSVTGGTLSITADSSLGNLPGGPVADQLTLDGGTLLNATTDATLAVNRGITLGSSGGTISVASGRTMVINGNITGPGALLKTYVSGTTVNVSLAGTNDFAGDFTITGGGLRFNNSSAGGKGRVIVDTAQRPSGGTANVTLRSLVAGSVTLTNDIVLNANNGIGITLDAGPGGGGTLADAFTMSGKFSGVGSAVRSLNTGNVSTLGLTGDNSQWSGGLTLTRYSTSLGHKNALGTTALILSPATANPSQVYLSASADLSGANAVTNAINLILTNSPAAPQLAIIGANNLEFSGPITLSGTSPTIANSNSAATILSGPISGTGFGITLQGTGTLTLKGNNTYDGITTISSGTVRVSNTSGSGTGTGAVTVQSGATLGGTGTIAGTVTVNSGGTFSPGASIGTLTLGASPILSGTTVMEIDHTGSSTNADKLVVSALLTFGGILTVNNSGATLTGGEVFDLFDATGFNGSFSVTNLPALGTGLNWRTENLGVDGTIYINRAPNAGNLVYTRAAGASLKIPKTDITSTISDPDSGDSASYDTLTSTGTQGATVTDTGTFITYEPVNNNSDTLQYRVTDTRSGVTLRTITINVVPQAGQATSVSVSGSTAAVSFAGIPGYSYQVQRSTNLTDWVTLVTTNAPPHGVFQWVDDFSDLPVVPPSAYYRVNRP